MGILGYIKLGGIGIIVLIIGSLYISNVHKERQLSNARTQLEVAKANLEVAEKTIKLLKEYQDVDKIIEDAPDDDVIEYLRFGVWRKSGGKAGNSPAAASGDSKAGKSGEGQKR